MRRERGERVQWKESYPQKVSTIFVDNLPHQIRKLWIYNLFSKFGKVKDIFIPNKRSKITGQSFAFVRFSTSDEADLAIARTNNTWCWDYRLFVKIAKFLRRKDHSEDNYQIHGGIARGNLSRGFSNQFWGRYQNPPLTQNRGTQRRSDYLSMQAGNNSRIWGKSRQNQQQEKRGEEVWRRKGIVETSRQGEARNAKEVNLQLQKEGNIFELQPSGNAMLYKSAVAIMKRLTHAERIIEMFRKEGFEKIQVRPMGGRFILITFADEKERDRAIKEKWLQIWFEVIKPWNEEPAQLERFVWLTCYGMPLSVWNIPTFKTIGSKWGHFIDVDDRTRRQESYEKGRVLIATEEEKKIEGKIQLKINGKFFMIKVEEETSFRIIEEDQQATISESKEEDDEVDKNAGDKDNRVENGNQSGDEMEPQMNEGADWDANSENGGGQFIVHLENTNEHAWDGSQQAFKTQEKVAEVVRSEAFPRKNNLVALEEVVASIVKDSNPSHELDSFVEDSESPIDEAFSNFQHLQNIAQKSVAQSKEKFDVEEQQKLAGEINQDEEEQQKKLERNIMLLDGPMVLGSDNSIRASQFASINLQVELNPKEARRALRQKISQECMDNDASAGTIGSLGLQDYHQNSIIQELVSTTAVGDRLGIEFTDMDTRHMKKLIEAETNRFAPLQRSKSNQR